MEQDGMVKRLFFSIQIDRPDLSGCHPKNLAVFCDITGFFGFASAVADGGTSMYQNINPVFLDVGFILPI